jgi:hypothetical protein
MARSDCRRPPYEQSEAGKASQRAERIAAQREARRAQRRHRILLTVGAAVMVLAVVAALVLVKVLGGKSPEAQGPVTGTLLSASVSRSVTDVPISTLAAVGPGPVPAFMQASHQRHAFTPVISGGKPEMLYIGAEFCPYCAGMRWARAAALSRFGTLSPLRGIHSAPSPEIYPDTATLTFYQTTYASNHLAFVPVEHQTVDHQPLQSLTRQQKRIWARYEPDPNTRGYPFTDIGNRYTAAVLLIPGAMAGQTWAQVAAAMADPSSPSARDVDGAANYLTAALCQATGQADEWGADGGDGWPGAGGDHGCAVQRGHLVVPAGQGARGELPWPLVCRFLQDAQFRYRFLV